jgi:lipopolysaccharide export system protein LptA
VKSQSLTYSDESGVAHYSGGVRLTRGALEVVARELRARFVKTEQESSLDQAFADGEVRIVRTEPEFTRTGSAEHAEYYAGEEKTVLYGGEPLIQDGRRGVTRGSRLTHYAKEDKLLVAGAADQPALTRILRK